MDEINAFFDFSKEFKREPIQLGAISGNSAACAGPSGVSSKPIKREQIGNEYAQSVVENEKKWLRMDTSNEEKPSSTVMDDLEGLSDASDSEDDEMLAEPNVKKDDPVFNKYKFHMNLDPSLPIFEKKDLIISKIRQHPVTIIEGDTGCGKTTQVPQYILEDAFKRREHCRIICTQPRRIAAISIAKRVCKERNWEEGTVIGFRVALHHKVSEDTRLTYCTTGVLLQSLITAKSLTTYTHIILDEVHERDQEIDFLMILLRRLWRLNSKSVKIILMSATINAQEFSDYFTLIGKPAPILNVDTFRRFHVREYYLDDLEFINSKHVKPDYNEPGISEDMYDIALKVIVVIRTFDAKESQQPSSILIFLPGINEIDEMANYLNRLCVIPENSMKLFPIRLHSQIPPDEQEKVFHRAPAGYHKVILATNIAESSITVPDVKFVIDFCLMKSTVTDTATNFTMLQMHWASRANCRQRSGRAGRVCNGRVYRLVSKDFYMSCLSEFGIPEMVRCPLESIVLKAKMLDIDSPVNILALAMTPPNLSDIQNTILTLKELGALFKHVDGQYTVQDGDLTYIGRLMAKLPLDARFSRLIMFGYIFSMLEESIIIAAGLSLRSIFNMHGLKHGDCDPFLEKLVWADGSGSDLFATLRAYRIWTCMREQNNIQNEAESSWAKRYFINLRSMKEMYLLVTELKQRLESFGIKEQTIQRVNWNDREKSIILKIIIAGAFYPNYFTRTNLNSHMRGRDIYHSLGGKDPCTTVYFTGFKKRNVPQLYTGAVKNLFRDVHIRPQNIDVRFQPGSERIFVTFRTDPECSRLLVPGRVCGEIYRAVRMRNEGVKFKIHIMDASDEIERAQLLELGTVQNGNWIPKQPVTPHLDLLVVPSFYQAAINGRIVHIENCSKFFFQPLFEERRLREMESILNDSEQIRQGVFENAAAVEMGMIVSAPSEGKYYRAKILQVVPSTCRELKFKVRFIDIGNESIVEFTHLRSLTGCSELIDVPPRVCECRLAMVQPSTVAAPNGVWPPAAMELLQQVADAGIVELDIYSVEGGIVNVMVNVSDTTTLNDVLVDKGLARKSDENYMSKMDHDLRKRKQMVASRFLDSDQTRQNEDYIRSTLNEIDIDVPPPPPDLCVGVVNLRGPFSPLETTICSVISIGAWKMTSIERDSVNSVLLDTDPQDAHERMIVAASISEQSRHNRLVARSTTLMPNIHGFGALMTLIFCPTMQLKTNKNQTRFAAILAGLGYDEDTGQSLYSEHDIAMSLDTEITTTDLSQINLLRHCMDSMMYCDPGEDMPRISRNDHAELAAKIKHILLTLLNKNRKYVETHSVGGDNVWEQYKSDDDEVMEQQHLEMYGKRAIFPIHKVRRLYDESYDYIQALSVHCQELHRFKQFGGEWAMDIPTCLLCNQPLENIAQVRIHLLSRQHRDREQQINFKVPRNL